MSEMRREATVRKGHVKEACWGQVCGQGVPAGAAMDFQGPAQEENGGPLFKIIKDFKTGTVEH